MVNKDIYNRANVRVEQDERILEFRHAPLNLTLPQAGIFDEPTRCYRVNLEWAKIITGAVSLLLEISAWKDAENEGYPGILEIQKFLSGEDCMDCQDVENCLLTSPTIIAIQDAISQAEANISDNTNRLDVAEADIQTLYLENDNQSIDIQQNSDDIAQLVLGQQAQQLKIDDHENRITVNEIDIQTIYLENDNQDTTLTDHENRITTLEAGGGGSADGFSALKVTPYIYQVGGSDLALTPTYATYITQQHQFTRNRAWIHIEIKGHTGSSGLAEFRTLVNSAIGANGTAIYADNDTSTEMNNLFLTADLALLGVPVDIEIQAKDTGAGYIDANQIVQIVVIEYDEPVSASPQQSTVTFDAGGFAYTLPANQDGTIQAIGHPNNCLAGPTQFPGWIEVEVDLGSVKQINGVFIDYLCGDIANSTARLFLDNNAMTPTPLSGTNGVWVEGLSIGYQDLPYNAQLVRVRLTKDTSGSIDMRLDNVLIDYQ